ncbi:MAG: 2-oxoacid:acceptor oxidoreductase family protein [Candidatus Auribacterota bacterium]|nr:2-oxoacid:acceptor oxidoreductase family protein [Candidatus Auribacterota bacterium]
MREITEIRWHGRGGQGAKTVAEFLALVALNEGKYSQGFPEYGPERSGAPIKGYTRISEGQIRMHSAIYHPDIVLVLDASLLDSINVCEGLKEDGIIIINTTRPIPELKEEYPFLKGNSIWTLDGNKISRDEIGKAIPNMPVLGALVKASGVVKLESVINDIRTEFTKKFSPEVLEGNIKAVKRAYEEVESE